MEGGEAVSILDVIYDHCAKADPINCLCAHHPREGQSKEVLDQIISEAASNQMTMLILTYLEVRAERRDPLKVRVSSLSSSLSAGSDMDTSLCIEVPKADSASSIRTKPSKETFWPLG